MKIVITGGHLTPALATMDALLKRDSKIEFHFFGRMHTREGDSALSAEHELMKERGVPFYAVTTGRLQRSFTQYTIPSLLKIPFGLGQCFKYLQEIRPDIVVSFGGYLAVPVVIAARILGIPIVSHEQTLVPGLANQIISRFATVLALSFEETEKHYGHIKTVLTGNPIRQEIFVHNNAFKLDKKGLPVVYVTCGNQGSHFINESIFRLLPRLLEIMHVIHQTGNSKIFDDHATAIQLKESMSTDTPGSYQVYSYVGPEIIGDIYGCADVVLIRAGINTICDLLALGKKGVVIPISKTSNNEQRSNATFFAKTGLGIALDQETMSDDVLYDSLMFLINKSVPNDVISSARSQIKLDAADRVADLVLSTV